MLVLILSILALFVGVGIYPLVKSKPSLISFFDAFVLISVIGLTLMHLIPHSVEGAGLWGVLAVCVGFGVPMLMHKFPHFHPHEGESESKLTQVLLIIALIGVITHTLLDGMGLSMMHVEDTAHANRMMLGLGVLFHRLPVGMFLGMMLIPRMGYKRAIGIATAMAVATALGFILGHFALPMASLTLLNAIQGLISGTLLHVIFHNVSLQGRSESPWPKGLGALFGLVTLVLIELLMPRHGESHTSVLENWVNYLWHAAPIWCVFAAILAICYGILRHAKPVKHDHDHDHEHHDQHWGVRLARWMCQMLDPQAMPALYGNTIHIFSAAGIVTLFTLFKETPAAIWWIFTLICLVIFKLNCRNLHVCPSCRPESLCNQHKSLGLWIATSWTQIACVTLIASVLPALLAPLTEHLAHLSTVQALVILAILCALILAIAIKKRSLSLTPCVLGALGGMILFAEVPYAQMLIAITFTALLCLYDYHPRDIRDAVDAGTSWRMSFFAASMICFVSGSVASFGLCHNLISAHPHTLAHFELHDHAHQHGVQDHKIEPQQVHNDEIEKKRETVPLHHDEITRNIETQRDHENSTHHESNHEGEGHDEVLNAHDLESDHTAYLRKRLPFLIIFILTGLILLLRMGPRQLFETAMGKHHHDHR